MKILYVSPYPPGRDGIGNYTWVLAHAARRLNNETRILVPYAAPGMPVEVIGMLRTAGRGYRQLQGLSGSWRPDVIHVQFAVAAFGMRTLAVLRWMALVHRKLNIPIVVTLHESVTETARLGPLARAVHRRLIASCDHVIIHSDAASAALAAEIQVPAGKLSIIPHPDAGPRPASLSARDLRSRYGLGTARVLLTFGFIHKDKGLEDLVRALPIVRSTKPDCLEGVRVVIAGDVRPRRGAFRIMEIPDRRYLARLQQLIMRSGLRDLVTMTGYVPDDEVASWFGLADAVVLPYRRAEQSGVLGLARTYGLPALASAVGGLVEQMGHASWSFPPSQPGALAEAIISFLGTPSGVKHEPSEPDATDLPSVSLRTVGIYRAVIPSEPGHPHVA
jgi:glycosyltransferase involved in cell wall biosynthesis